MAASALTEEGRLLKKEQLKLNLQKMYKKFFIQFVVNITCSGLG
jgi:hypothetical protein